MRYLLVDASGLVGNAIEAESVEIAQSLFPDHQITQHDLAGPGWKLVDGAFVPPEPEPEPMWEELPTYEFLSQFTPQEWSAFAAARVTDPYIGQLMHILDRAPTVHRNNRLLRSGMVYATSIGLLSAARAAEIIGEA